MYETYILKNIYRVIYDMYDARYYFPSYELTDQQRTCDDIFTVASCMHAWQLFCLLLPLLLLVVAYLY